MTAPPTDERGLALADLQRRVLRRFAAYAAARFPERPGRRSIVLAVAQYWNDSADDEVHATVVFSARDTPVWPHECSFPDEDPAWPALPGEECEWCMAEELRARDDQDFSFHGWYGDDMVAAFELFCREGASQDMDPGEAYVPYAIARLRGGGVDVELVGRPQRPANTRIGEAAVAHDPWRDARPGALFDEVCRTPLDDGARVVLSDWLLEHRPDDPRGEAIARSLVRDPSAAERAQRDALIAAHLAAWIHPLGAVIPPGCAHVERGFLARADVHAPTPAEQDRVAGARAWGTVEVLRMTPGSLEVLDPAMVALREVGPLGADGIRRLCGAPRPWAIERLHVTLEDLEDPDALPDELDQLAGTTLLPRLTHLVLTVPPAAAIHAHLLALARAPWWPQLARVTLIVDKLASLEAWRAARPAHAWLAITLAGDDRQPAGWEVAFGPEDAVEIAMVGWHREGTMVRLAQLVGELPADAAIHLRSTPDRSCGEDERCYLLVGLGRDVTAS